MDPVEKLSQIRTEEFLSQLHYALDPNAKQTLKLNQEIAELMQAMHTI
jgi:hypothetical protein